jgi:hypothetical protein
MCKDREVSLNLFKYIIAYIFLTCYILLFWISVIILEEGKELNSYVFYSVHKYL